MHCHLQWHIVVSPRNESSPIHLPYLYLHHRKQSGMAVVLIEGEEKLPGLLGSKAPPTISRAVSFRSGYKHIAWATVVMFLLF